MYQVRAVVYFENYETRKEKIFDYWCDATAWIEDFANEDESLLSYAIMEIVR